jgi:hypothetical protein
MPNLFFAKPMPVGGSSPRRSSCALIKSQNGKIMREMVLLGTAAAMLAFGASDAGAMGGGGDLSPSESPYAILEPQTVAPPAAAIMASESPTRVVHRAPARRQRSAHGVKKRP